MAEQTITKLKLDFSHNVKKSDVETVNELSQSVEKLFESKLDNDVSKNLSTLGNALKTFKGITINQNLGKGILGLVDAANDITNIKDISPYAYRLKESFKVLRDVTEPFKGKSPSINAGLGKGITGLIDAANAITEVKDISPYAENLTKGFIILSESAANFNDFNAKIPANLGVGITGIVDAINRIEDVKDISLQGDNLRTGFHILSYISRNFEGSNIRIPVNLGRGITGLVDAINEIDEVRDISGKAEVIKNSFNSIAQASLMFDGMNTADYTGISRLVTSLSNVGKIKKIDDNVIKNAETLAKAINVLDKEVKADIPKLKEMSNIAKDLGVQFKSSSGGVDKFGGSLRSLNIAATVQNIRTLTRTLSTLALQAYGTVESFGEVENTLSFFGQSLGSQAESTAAIIQQYANIGAIDFTQFADQTAKLNQIYKGYGIEAENAAKMALNMTQIAYDASYALGENGKDIQLWFDRAVSVSTGQARSGYYFGVDTSVQALKESFDELSSSTDKANKVTAAYNAIIENTREIQGQMPREFQNTYVQMDVLRNRINLLKQSIGQALIPMFQSLIKWAQIAIAVVERTIDAIVRLFGGKGFKLIDYSSMIQNTADATGGLSDNAVKAADGFGQANKQAKELKKTISGIDQVFTIDDRKPSDSGGGVGAGVGGGAGIAPVEGYDWLETLANAENLANLKSINDTADAIFEKIKNAVPYVAAIAAGFAAWKISKTLLDGLKWISGTKDIFGGLGLDKLALPVGLLALGKDLMRFKDYVKDFMENGPTFDNVTGMISTFVGAIGDITIATGNVQIGGLLKLVQGVSEVVAAIYDITQEGFNWDNVEKMLYGLSNVAIGIGVLKGNWQVVGVGLFMQGALGIIGQISDVWNAIRTGDWSGVDKGALFIDLLLVVGGVAIAIGKFKSTVETANKGKNLTKAAETTQTMSDATGGVSIKLKDLAKNMAWGILILVEVAAAALIFVGAIWAVGELLQKVGEAWAPVIADGANVSAGIVLGTALLAAVGLATWKLGTIAIAGTGTLPLAIAAGTAMLVLLTAATVLFIQELKLVGDQLSQELAPSMARLNEVLPDLTENTRQFTLFMIEFAGHLVAYTAASAVAGLAATIDTIVGWFTKDPIKKLTDDAAKNEKQFTKLNNQLTITNPLVQKGADHMDRYGKLLETLKTNADRAAAVGSPKKIGSDFKDFSKSLKDGFADLDKTKTSNVSKIMEALKSIDLNKFKGIGKQIVESMELGMTSYNFNLKQVETKVKTGLTFSVKSLGTDKAKDVNDGINNYSVNLSTFTTKLKNALTFSTKSYGTTIGRDVVSGVNSSSVSLSTFTNKIKNALTFSARSYGTTIGGDVVSGINSRSVSIGTFTNRIKSAINFSSRYLGTNIASGVTSGINGYWPNVTTFTNRLKNAMTNAFDIRSPSRWAKQYVGAYIGEGVTEGVNETKVDFNPFKDSVKHSMYGIMEEVDVSPNISMPTINTKELTGSVSDISKDLNAKVSGQFDYSNDGTEKAIVHLTQETVDKMERLIQAVEDGKTIEIDGDKIGEVSDKYIKGKAVRNNMVFGSR